MCGINKNSQLAVVDLHVYIYRSLAVTLATLTEARCSPISAVGYFSCITRGCLSAWSNLSLLRQCASFEKMVLLRKFILNKLMNIAATLAV
jgi:hypothetical protein